MSSASRLARAWHDARCVSHYNGTCSGSHMPSWVARAKRVLAAPDPVRALHDDDCPNYLEHSSYPGLGRKDCSRDAGHVSRWRRLLDHDADQPALFGGGS